MESENNNEERPKKVLGVEFAPLNLPLERRLQTLSIIVVQLVFVFYPLISYPLLFYLLFFSNYTYVAATVIIPYLIWMWFIDRDTYCKGARASSFVRGWKLWKSYNEYFPIKIVKTVDLDPKRNYLFCGHPHGLLCTGVVGCFGTDGNITKELFPGLQFSILTFNVSFIFPIIYELVVLLGICSASRESMNYLLSHPDGGRAAIIIPGGAPEALDLAEYTLQLKERKGFIKVALQNGSPLVPVFSFGEIDIYDKLPNPRGSIVRKIQDGIQRLIQVPPIIFYGRGVFQYSFGFLPKRRPITVVVGAPVPVKKIDHPTKSQIDELHNQYVEALKNLFYANREKYALDPKSELTIVER